MIKCPHCITENLEPCLCNLHTGDAISYHCLKCLEEFYVFTNGILLTHKEFVARRQDNQ